MKKALILHGTDDSHLANWFPWLKDQLEFKGFQVWVPDLPRAEKPNLKRYNQFLLSNSPWPVDQDTILIGHSSGAVAILGLLQALPPEIQVNTCYLVSAFKDTLGWDALDEFFNIPISFKKIKSKASKFIFIHSDDDPHVPLEHAQYLSKQVAGQLIIKKGQKHFSVSSFGEQYRQFPFLLELIEK